MSLAERNESAVRAWPRAMPIDAMAGPMTAAVILPAAVMMAGFVTAWGVGLGFASALVAIRRQGAPAPANDPALPQVETLPRLALVAGPAAAAPKPATPKDGGLKTPGPGVPPKPAKPGGAPPKPKSAAAPLVAAPKPATPKDGGLKAPGPGVPSKPAKPGGTPAKPKSAGARPATARVAPARRKATPVVTVAPAKLESTTTAKGISLPRLSIQDDKPDDPAKT